MSPSILCQSEYREGCACLLVDPQLISQTVAYKDANTKKNKSMKEEGKMEIKKPEQKQYSACVTYRNSTDNGDLPVFLLIRKRLSNSDRDRWLAIFGIGLLILQLVFMMLGPTSTHILALHPLKGEYEYIQLNCTQI